MKRVLLWLGLLLPLLCVSAAALELPTVLPYELRRAVGDGTVTESGIRLLLDRLRQETAGVLREEVGGSVRLLLLLLLCGMGEWLGGREELHGALTLFGVFGVLQLTLGELRSFAALGTEVMTELAETGKLLVPTVAAAMAAGGSVSAAGLLQAGSLFASELLLRLIHELLLPLSYCAAALMAVGALVPQSRLETLGTGLVRLLGWALGVFLTVFTLFLTLGTSVAGAADRTAGRLAKAAAAAAIPVVGSLLADTAESVFASAGALRAGIGAAGVFFVLLLTVMPLLRIGLQYALYRICAVFAALLGTKPLDTLLEQLGSVLALIFAMTAAGAVLLLSSFFSAAAMVG